MAHNSLNLTDGSVRERDGGLTTGGKSVNDEIVNGGTLEYDAG